MSRDAVGGIVRIALALASIAIYAAAVLSIHQERTGPFLVEQDGSIPVVVSHWLLGAPFGLADAGLQEFFSRGSKSDSHSISAEKAVESAFQGAATPTHDLSIPRNGTGVGGPIMVELAFLLFGPHARSLVMFFVLLIGISSACFVVRYRDERLSAVPIVLLALTLLLILRFSGPPRPTYVEVPIGGLRYYSVIGILPALHWCFEVCQSRAASRSRALLRWVTLGIQTAILGLSILVRGSPVYLLIPVAASAVLALRTHTATPERRSILARLLIPGATLLIGIMVLPPLAFPEYAKAGRTFQNIWHRVFLSLGMHPAWPFPDVRKKYVCPLFSGHVGPGVADDTGYCVWWDYGRRHGVSDATLSSKLYDPDYEAALRTAFFDAIRAHPREALEVFLYYKPKQTLEQIGLALRPEWPSVRPVVWILAVLQIMLVIAFIGARPPPAPFRDAVQRAGVLAGFLMASLIPQWIVWTLPWTAIDLFAFVLCGCIIVLWLAASYGIHTLDPRRRANLTRREATKHPGVRI